MGFGKDGKGVIFRQSLAQSIGTLAADTVLLISTKPAILERFRIIKSEVWATIVAKTDGEQRGMVLGLADGTLTLAEIEEAIESNGPLGPNETVEAEIGMRPMWMFGASVFADGTDGIFLNEDGGPLMSETIRWTFSRTASWNWFLYNSGVAPTTGSTIKLRAKNFGVWVL